MSSAEEFTWARGKRATLGDFCDRGPVDFCGEEGSFDVCTAFMMCAGKSIVMFVPELRDMSREVVGS